MATKLCPYFEKIDLFLRDKPLTSPHFMASSSEDPDGEVEDMEDSPVPLPAAIAMPDLPTDTQPETHAHASNDDTTASSNAQENCQVDRSITPPRIPGKSLRKKKASYNKDLDAEQLLLEHREFAAKSEKLLEQHLALEKKKYEEQRVMLLEDRAVMKNWMEQQKEESKGMLSVMGEMVGILKGLQPKNLQQPPQPTQPFQSYPNQWTYSNVDTSGGQGYAGDYRSYQPDQERPLDFHQL
jgi:hypothetical protein